jgi:hypothetical protein
LILLARWFLLAEAKLALAPSNPEAADLMQEERSPDCRGLPTPDLRCSIPWHSLSKASAWSEIRLTPWAQESMFSAEAVKAAEALEGSLDIPEDHMPFIPEMTF